MKAVILLKTLLLGKWIRDNNIVLVINAYHDFTGNCKYATLAIRQQFPEKKIIWVVKEDKQHENLQYHNIQTVLLNSLEYMQILSRAKYIISDIGFIPNFASHGAKQIHFWHGTAIKKINYDGNGAYAINSLSYWKKRILMWLNRKNFVQSGTSQHDADLIAKSIHLPKGMTQPLGTPRIAPLVDIHILNQNIQQNPLIKKVYEENSIYEKIYLYAPTFRDDKSDFLTYLHFDMQKLISICTQKNIRFLIKNHPSCHIRLTSPSEYVKILDKRYDPTLCIAISDVIITDYSSIYHDTITTDKDIILMHGDIQQYRQYSRDIYDEQLKYMQGHTIDNFKDLYNILENNIAIHPIPNNILSKHWDSRNLQNTNRFLELIK